MFSHIYIYSITFVGSEIKVIFAVIILVIARKRQVPMMYASQATEAKSRKYNILSLIVIGIY